MTVTAMLYSYVYTMLKALIPRLFGNSIPGHTTMAPQMQTQAAVRVEFQVPSSLSNRLLVKNSPKIEFSFD